MDKAQRWSLTGWQVAGNRSTGTYWLAGCLAGCPTRWTDRLRERAGKFRLIIRGTKCTSGSFADKIYWTLLKPIKQILGSVPEGVGGGVNGEESQSISNDPTRPYLLNLYPHLAYVPTTPPFTLLLTQWLPLNNDKDNRVYCGGGWNWTVWVANNNYVLL